MLIRTMRAGSIQSKLTCRAFGSPATMPASRNAMSRTCDMSGPLTRYWIGQPTGGPSPSGDTRATALGNCVASTSSSRACSRSRAATSLAMTTAWAKKSLGSSTASGR